MPEEKIFNAKAANLNYLDWGPPSADPLVMLHGGAWSWQEYLSLIPSLAQKWHVYALDFRGNGRSGWVPDTYRLQDFVEDNAQFLGRLKAPTVLAGHSLGGVVALILAARFPDRLKALILEDPPITLENYRKIIESSRDMFGVWLELKKRAQSEHELGLLLAEEYTGYPGVTSSRLLFFARCLWQLDPTFFSTMLRDFEEFAADYDGQQLLASALPARRNQVRRRDDRGGGLLAAEGLPQREVRSDRRSRPPASSREPGTNTGVVGHAGFSRRNCRSDR